MQQHMGQFPQDGKNFKIFDSQELVLGISVPNGASFSRKQIDNLIATVWEKPL